MHSDDIRDFIDGLEDASGFETATTAVDGWQPGDPAWRNLEEFVLPAYIRCMDRYADYGEPPCFDCAVIEDDVRGRLYEQGPCETRKWFRDRLGHEARLARDPWLFLLQPVAGATATARTPGIGDPLLFVFQWFVEVRSGELATKDWGEALVFRERSVLASYGLRPPNRYDQILRGHPARRRHPIRRS